MEIISFPARSSAEELSVQLQALPWDFQLTRVLKLLSETSECEEQLNHITSKAWTYVVQNELWTACIITLQDVKTMVDWSNIS